VYACEFQELVFDASQGAGRQWRKARGVRVRHPDLAGEPDAIATAGQQGREGSLTVGVGGIDLGDPGFEHVVDDSLRRLEVSRVPEGHGAEHKTDIAGGHPGGVDGIGRGGLVYYRSHRC
jgi:hypothetical protein